MNKLHLQSVLLLLAIIFSLANVSPAAACASSGSPTISTDKADYGAFETVIISGAGFGCGEVLSVKVTAPDGSFLAGNGTGSPGPDVVTTDGNGEFTLSYALSGTISVSVTSAADGVYAGQSGTYIIDVISSANVVLASTTFTDQSQLGNPVPASVIVTYNGLEWVWASPCPLNSCTSGILIGKDGFNFATPAQWALRPPVSAFFFSKCAAPWFDLTWNHCDWFDPDVTWPPYFGAFGSAPLGGLPAGLSGSTPMQAGFETWLVRGILNAPPSVDTGGPYPVDEGGSILVVASGSDPNGDYLTYAWDLDNNGSFETPGQSATFSASALDGPSSHTIAARVTDSGGLSAEDTAIINVQNVAPTAIFTDNGPVDEGNAFTLSLASPSDPSSLDTAAGFTYAFDCGSGYGGYSSSYSATCATTDNGTPTVRGKIRDKDGSETEYTGIVTVNNAPPQANFTNDGPVNEGSPFTLSLVSPFDPSSADTAAGLQYAFDCGSGYGTLSASSTASCSTDDNGTRAVKGKIQDKDGGFNEYLASVTINNVAPTLGAISVDTALAPVNTAINATASFTDPGTLDTHTALWDWGDATTVGTVTESAGSGSVNGSHAYSTPGVYTVKLTVTDKDTAPSNESIYQYVVVYDPNGGFVTGGGWIDSPAGAYKLDTSLAGKASFGFVSKYLKGATVPTGNTEFQFQAAGLKFHSNSYEWLVVTGGNYAKFKGTGMINEGLDPNGNPFKFMIWAGDGSLDTFRIRIWWEGTDGTEYDVYDNGIDQAIGGGSIVVHTKK